MRVDLVFKILFHISWRIARKIGAERLMVNDVVMKLLIGMGVFKWFDAPHLHSPLINLRLKLERASA